MKILSFLSSLLLSAAALAQSTAFTYQGDLKTGAAPANGLHDFRFRLFDALTAGTQIGTTQCADNVSVSNGAFTVTLDFGQQFASTSPRFLEIQTRTDIGQPCVDDFRYVLLTPRQQCTAAPLANRANSAFALSAPDGSPANALVVDNNGSVGIGTATPSSALHIRQVGGPALLLQDSAESGSQQGMVTFMDSIGTVVGRAGFQNFAPVWSMVNLQANGHICFFPGPAGNVGIGTSSPLAKLDVRGDIRMGANGTQFATRGEENLRVLRGTIALNGTIQRGAGFTTTRLAAGRYRISYNQSFTSVPAVFATAYRSPEAVVASIESSTISQVTISTFNGAVTDQAFDFVVIGGQ